MADIIERLRFDAARCELQFSKGVAGNITEAAAEIERLRAALKDERERCARHVELIGADWRESGADQKFYASEYLAAQLRDLPGNVIEQIGHSNG